MTDYLLQAAVIESGKPTDEGVRGRFTLELSLVLIDMVVKEGKDTPITMRFKIYDI